MAELPKKEVYSAYDISRLCPASLDHIYRCLDEGLLEFFKITGGHRRIPHSSFEKFISENHYPIPPFTSNADVKYRVLIVEDDPDLLEIIGELLNDEPRLEVRKEDNGFNAGLQIASWHPDLILLDFIMPGLNGFEVCKKIREHPETRDIPVLALTSLTTFENRKAVMDSGVSDFLGKPFYSESLLRKVRVLIGLESEIPLRTSRSQRLSDNPMVA
jgi:excisionase family DNA binding protein